MAARNFSYGAPRTVIGGGNVTAQWRHKLDDDSSLQLLAYYDESQRQTVGGGGFHLNTYDLEFQHDFFLGNWNQRRVGCGRPHPSLLHHQPYRGQQFAGCSCAAVAHPQHGRHFSREDHIALGDAVQLTVGLKLENDPYSGVSPMPSMRLSWKPDSDNLLWGAVSRVIRSPTPFDTDVQEKLGPVLFLTGDPNFPPEQSSQPMNWAIARGCCRTCPCQCPAMKMFLMRTEKYRAGRLS